LSDSDSPLRPVRRPRRQRRKPRNPNPEARQRLLDAGRELVFEVGVPELRVEEVASRAGLAVGTFYLYFEGKTDLFVQLVMEHTQLLRDRLREAYASEGSWGARTVRALDAYLEFLEENRMGFLYFRDASGIETTEGRLGTWAFRQHAEDLRAVFEQGIDAGELRNVDANLAAQAVLGLMQHMAGWWLEQDPRPPRREMTAFLSRLVAEGLRA
jgi:AcrR family transcriptional regulator